MSLEKLTVTPMSKDLKARYTSFQVPFNPDQYTISKNVNWRQTGASSATSGSQGKAGEGSQTQIYLDAPTLEFAGGQSRQLTLNLFFDTTETGGDVREQTGQIVALTRKDRNEKCPLPCEISWGMGQSPNYDFPFVGVITILSQNFIYFNASGVPLRAKLTVTLMEYADPEKNQRETDPELTTRLVKAGDTVSSIAGEFYGNPGLWRAIADANGLDDPRNLQPGTTLTIPKIG